MSETIINTAVFAEEAAMLKGKNMIAVVSGRRGSGKTWFAVTLSHALSLAKQKVLLFDGDCGSNNVKAQLGAKGMRDLDAVLYSGHSLNQVVSGCDKAKFDIIYGNSKSSGLSAVSVGRLQILSDDLNILAQNYDKAILDIRSGLSDQAKVFAGMSQTAIVVCTDKIQSVTDCYGLIKLITSRYPKTSVKIVVNRVNTIAEGLRTYKILDKACREFLNFSPPLLGIVREDTRVRDSIRNQTTIISRYPQSEAALDIYAIAKRIVADG